ncbi:MAG: hypothetical protein L6R39_007285 [Caloplaca ligustica]|nr:MAG: hypothetical protein L6R39_007285 [Caloplaca ligustica]
MDITRFIIDRRDKALLVGDYALYRKQLSRRLLVVRKKLKRTTRGRKYTPKASITAEDIASNHEFVYLLLLSAERAWALAMHMKSTHAADQGARGITGSTKRHVVSRFQKANTYATHLVNLLQEDASGASTQSLLQARAYQQSLQGAIAFEKGHWERCLRSYAETRLLYTALAQSQGTKQDDLFKDLLSNTIDPSLRYAAYQLKLPRTLSIEAIVARYVPRENNSFVAEALQSNPDLLQEPGTAGRKSATGDLADVPRTITWRSRTVKLEDATIAQALASVAAAETTLKSFLSANQKADRRARAAAYDDVLLPSQDAVDATKTAIDELTADGVHQGDQRMQSLQITRTAVNYNLVEWRVGRNRVLCGEQDGVLFESEVAREPGGLRADGEPREEQEESTGRKLNRLKERVVLYDSTIQSLNSVKEFPGVAADEAFVSELEAKKAYFSSLRCLAIARSHMLHGNKRNALALLSRALDSSPHLSSPSPSQDSDNEGAPKLEISPAQIRALKDLLERSVLQHRALVEVENLSSSRSQKNDFKPPPVIERLDEYPPGGVDLTNLVTYPPKLQPVPVKPIFLDVAWNYIDYPGRPKKGAVKAVDAKSEAAVEPKKETKKGWFGFGR